MKEAFFETVKVLFVVFVIVGLSIGAILLCEKADMKQDEYIYNNGICRTCGHELKFSNASKGGRGAGSTTYYYYSCDECGNVVELHFPVQKILKK